MRIFGDRKIAILITVVVAVLATLFGVYRTSNRNKREIEAMFSDGVFIEDGGYTEPGIASHLSNAADAALGLATITANYPEFAEKADELTLARRDLLTANGISGKGSAFLVMSNCFYELFMSAANTKTPGQVSDLSARDLEAAKSYCRTYDGASIAILNSGYNDKVAEYLEGRSMLNRLIGLLVFAKQPASFVTPYIPL